MHSHTHSSHSRAQDLAVFDIPLVPREEDGSHYEVSNPSNPTADFSSGLTGVTQSKNYLFVNILVAITFLLCAITLLARLTQLGNNHLRHLFSTGVGREKQTYWMYNKTSWWPWIKRHLLYAPFWSKRHNRELQLSSAWSFGTLPSRFHSLLLFIYLLVNLVYCVALDYGKKRDAIFAELRGRTGALAAYNMIPTVIFALRNNPFIPLLQVSYDTFNLLHRWTARIVVIEGIVHAFAWGAAKFDQKGWEGISKGIDKSIFLQSGLVTAVVMLTMTVQAWSPIRHAFYETFLNIHRLLALAAFVGLYMHLNHGELPQIPWGYLIFVLWALEYAFRSGRVLYYNYTRQRTTRVTVEALPAEACRITLQIPRHWSFKPGAHAYVYVPRFGLWSSHPFSIAWSRDFAMNNMNEKLPTTSYDNDLDSKDKVQTNLSMITRARTGITRKLYDAARATPNGMVETWGAIEGPYGGHESLDSYGTVVLFAGGVGITHQISYIRHLVAHCADGTVATRKIILVWSVPNTEALEWVRPWMDEILKMPGRREILKIMLFVTKPKSMQEVISGTGTVQMFPGRCNPQTILDKEIVERVGAMVVTVCGPGGFADSVRHAVRRRVTKQDVSFIEESFTW